MTETINMFFSNIFGNNSILATILIATIPIIELRGAIPFGVNLVLWGEFALNIWQSFLYGLIGSCLIVPILALIFTPLIKLLKNTKMFRKIACAIENYIKNKSQKFKNSDSSNSRALFKKLFFIFIFVAIPLPLTGVWTGTCVSLFLGLNYFQTCLTVIAGNIIAGLLIVTILTIFPWLNDWLLLIFVLIVIIAIIVEIVKNSILKHKNKN